MGDTLVLCYHAISDDWQAGLGVPPTRLEEQLTFLVERGYRGATFTEGERRPAIAALDEEGKSARAASREGRRGRPASRR